MTFHSRLLTELSTSQRQQIASDPRAVAILPIGAIEQHGPHLPVGTDSLIAALYLDALCALLSEEDRVVIAPALHVTKSTEHLDFPGTLSLDRRLLLASVDAMVQQLRAWGFSRVALLNTHGGNGPVLRSRIREAHAQGDQDLRLIEISPDLSTCSEREQRYGIHAGEYETSLLLARVPELCQMEHADCVWIDERLPHPDLQPENAAATFSWVSADLSPTGTMGDATLASPGKGERWIREVAEHILIQLRSWDPGEGASSDA